LEDFTRFDVAEKYDSMNANKLALALAFDIGDETLNNL